LQYNAAVYYSLCLASNWEYDEGFIRLLDSALRARGRHLLTVVPSNLADILPRLATGEVGFSALLDRASESDSAFLPLVEIAKATNARRFNPRELADQAYNKAAMHYKFIEAGIHTPQTVILPAYNVLPALPDFDLALLGEKFSIKPALGGGGEGVRNEATRFEEARRERMKFPEQQYLLQAHVTPRDLDGFPAWFRVVYCLGDVHPSYWDVTTHVYRPLPDESSINSDLRATMIRIAGVCKLDLFSSELALTEDNRLLAVDYVNDPIDLRLQSASLDGVPDAIAGAIAERLAGA